MSPSPSSAMYTVFASANQMPNGYAVVFFLSAELSVDGKPRRMHMFDGRPLVCSSVGSYASGESGSRAPGVGRPTPFGHASPDVSTKYTVLTPLLPLPLVK